MKHVYPHHILYAKVTSQKPVIQLLYLLVVCHICCRLSRSTFSFVADFYKGFGLLTEEDLTKIYSCLILCFWSLVHSCLTCNNPHTTL